MRGRQWDGAVLELSRQLDLRPVRSRIPVADRVSKVWGERITSYCTNLVRTNVNFNIWDLWTLICIHAFILRLYITIIRYGHRYDIAWCHKCPNPSSSQAQWKIWNLTLHRSTLYISAHWKHKLVHLIVSMCCEWGSSQKEDEKWSKTVRIGWGQNGEEPLLVATPVMAHRISFEFNYPLGQL